jgi:hypothetical protein
MKKLIVTLVVITLLSSCKKEWDEYVDISSTGVSTPTCPNAPTTPPPPPPPPPVN